MSMSNQTGRLFWLASYPKSGNTWTRIFLSNLLNDSPESVDINAIDTGAIASSREWVQAAFGFNLNELSHDEIDQLRPLAYQWLSEQTTEYEYHKTHDAYTYVNENEPLFPVSATAGAVIIVRNPLDVAVSFAHHNGELVDKTVKRLNDEQGGLCVHKDRIHNQLRQTMLSWSGFYKSWMDAPIAKCIVRYEDMHSEPFKTFSRIAHFLQIPAQPDDINRAIAQSSMSSLQQQEAEKSFREKSSRASSFFRKGAVGDWVNHLTEEQITTLIASHADMMKQLGYLNNKMEPEIMAWDATY